MRTSAFLWSVLVSALLFGATLAACGEEDEEPARGPFFTVPDGGAPPRLNPTAGGSGASSGSAAVVRDTGIGDAPLTRDSPGLDVGVREGAGGTDAAAAGGGAVACMDGGCPFGAVCVIQGCGNILGCSPTAQCTVAPVNCNSCSCIVPFLSCNCRRQGSGWLVTCP